MAKPKVFLDSSVIITALLSAQGGSFYILNQLQDFFAFQTNEYALAEIQTILQTKFAGKADLTTQLFLLLGIAGVKVLANPSKQEVIKAEKYISQNDAPILAGALANSNYLLTLDNEFLKTDILAVAKKKSLTILKPKDFIETFKTAGY